MSALVAVRERNFDDSTASCCYSSGSGDVDDCVLFRSNVPKSDVVVFAVSVFVNQRAVSTRMLLSWQCWGGAADECRTNFSTAKMVWETNSLDVGGCYSKKTKRRRKRKTTRLKLTVVTTTMAIAVNQAHVVVATNSYCDGACTVLYSLFTRCNSRPDDTFAW